MSPVTDTPCTGTLLWFCVPEDARFLEAAVIECSACGYLVVTGSFFDERHVDRPIMRAN